MCSVLNASPLTDERQKVLELYRRGLSVREMASVLGVSTQRVYQQLRKLSLSSPSKPLQQKEAS